MKVQRVRLPETDRVSWLVLDDSHLPVGPIRSYLKFRCDTNRSPDTVRADAHHLKLFWEFLRHEGVAWTDVDVSHLGSFITWLRRPDTEPQNDREISPRRTDATIDQSLTAVHGFYDFHMRLGTVPDLPLYAFLQVPSKRYKPFLYGIAKAKPVRSRAVRLKHEKRVPGTLSHDEVGRLLEACDRLRDRFLVHLLYDTGMRIGQVLGLRHEDIKVEDGRIRVVPRDDNANGARAKAREPYHVFPSPDVMDLYVRYLVEELDALEASELPDYVFVNLWEGEVGRPMRYQAVRSLFRRLGRKAGVGATPHMLRHSRATQWVRDGLPLPTISRLLGHASIATTNDIYVHLAAPDVRAHLDTVRDLRTRATEAPG